MRLRPSAGLLASIVAVVAVSSAAAQGSPYLSLDDPRLPLLEHLIARGEVKDPSPQIRPLLQRDALAALREAARDSAGPSARLMRELLHAWELPSSDPWWRVAPRAGAQAYTQGRRELLQPGGQGDVQPYVDAAFTLGVGPLVASSRAAWENRLRDDPDYRPYQPIAGLRQLYRFIEGYATAQWSWGGLHFGQIERNWGPVGLFGIPIGNYGYPRTDLSFWFGSRTVRFEAVGAPLRGGVNENGEAVTRWFAAHRLNVRVLGNLNLALWETAVTQRAGGGVDPTILNPFLLWTFGRQLGLGGQRNVMLGSDATWRPSRRLLLQAQGAIDDFTFFGTNPYPSRFGLGLVGAGALGRALSWRASYAMNSSLAYHTFDANENFTDAGVGIGRNFIDNDQFSLSVGVPLRASWLVTPQLQLMRQGEGRLDQPFPDEQTAATLPLLFIGTRRDTWQVGVGVNGQERGLALSGLAGLQHVRNAGHVSDATETRVVGRIQATLGFRLGGVFQQ
jgi:hypothetical protein